MNIVEIREETDLYQLKPAWNGLLTCGFCRGRGNWGRVAGVTADSFDTAPTRT